MADRQKFEIGNRPRRAKGLIAMTIGPVLAWRRGNIRAALLRLMPALIGAILAPELGVSERGG